MSFRSKKKKILVLGASGMLGSMSVKILAQNPDIELSAAKRNVSEGDYGRGYYVFEFDAASNCQNLPKDYDYIINCLAILSVKPNDLIQDKENAIFINSIFPHQLARNYPNSKIIQISTDGVFTGDNGPYDESHLSDSYDFYGRTKSLGEVTSANFFNIRCSIVGQKRAARKQYLLDWFLSRGHKDKINGFTNHIWNGVTTLAFAKMINGVINSGVKLPNLHHWVPANKVSKFELLNIFKNAYGRGDVEILSERANKDVNRELKTLNPPLNNVLWGLAGYRNVPNIEELIADLKAFEDNNQAVVREEIRDFP